MTAKAPQASLWGWVLLLPRPGALRPAALGGFDFYHHQLRVQVVDLLPFAVYVFGIASIHCTYALRRFAWVGAFEKAVLGHWCIYSHGIAFQ